MRLRPLNPAVTGYTHGPTGVEYVVDEHGTIIVPIEVAEAMLEYPNTWVVDHTVTGPEPTDPAADDVPPTPPAQDALETANGADLEAPPTNATDVAPAGEAADAPDDAANTAEPEAVPAKPTRARKSTTR